MFSGKYLLYSRTYGRMLFKINVLEIVTADYVNSVCVDSNAPRGLFLKRSPLTNQVHFRKTQRLVGVVVFNHINQLSLPDDGLYYYYLRVLNCTGLFKI